MQGTEPNLELASELSFGDIADAAERIRGIAHRTPVMTSRALNKQLDKRVFIKCENFQRGGSFKVRGALNAVLCLAPEVRARGVLAHSSGNFAQGLALAARQVGIPAAISQ